MSEEKLPISEKLKVLDAATIYRSQKWWAAVALVDSFGRKQIAMYLWLNREGKWKRNQKYIIHSRNEWTQVKEVIEKFIPQLT